MGGNRRSAVLLAVRIDARLQIFDDAGTSAFVDCLNQTSHIPAHSAKQGGARRRRGKGTKEKSDKKIGFIIVRPPLPVRQRLKGTRTDRTVRAPPLRRRLRIRPPKQPKPRQISVYIPEERTHGGSGRGFGVGCVEAVYMALRADKFVYFRQSEVRAYYPEYPRMRFIRRAHAFIFYTEKRPLVYSTEGR